mmetsp:Transcript_9443/g.29134  ORF Transcript_9443/g.29134 Transcript_9443/m.29134 type:complete len:617 (-) Transcript_9443:54-1904(-)
MKMANMAHFSLKLKRSSRLLLALGALLTLLSMQSCVGLGLTVTTATSSASPSSASDATVDSGNDPHHLPVGAQPGGDALPEQAGSHSHDESLADGDGRVATLEEEASVMGEVTAGADSSVEVRTAENFSGASSSPAGATEITPPAAADHTPAHEPAVEQRRTPGVWENLSQWLRVQASALRPRLVGIRGTVDDCCCSAEVVDRFNNHQLNVVLDELVSKTYFKYFKVDYLKDCPFWVEEYLCSASEGADCGVCACEEHEIPEAFRAQDQLSRVNTALVSDFHGWNESSDSQPWIYQEEHDVEMYINLELNPERYTGYGQSSGGGTASRIWMEIYKENCFRGDLDDQCLEERVFYRLISGLHASTTAHIAEFYHTSGGRWEPNLGLFTWGVGMWPDRLSNIYFTYVFLLRAAHKVEHVLKEYDFDTGNPVEDSEVRALLSEFYSSELLCTPTFNETTLFEDPHKLDLKVEFREKFRNISRLMDCVACETCKIHAKLQVLGIGTALRILLSKDAQALAETLQRNEVIALVNTIQKFSDSIRIIASMREREQTILLRRQAFFGLLLLGVLCLAAVFLRFLRRRCCSRPRSSRLQSRWDASGGNHSPAAAPRVKKRTKTD